MPEISGKLSDESVEIMSETLLAHPSIRHELDLLDQEKSKETAGRPFGLKLASYEPGAVYVPDPALDDRNQVAPIEAGGGSGASPTYHKSGGSDSCVNWDLWGMDNGT